VSVKERVFLAAAIVAVLAGACASSGGTAPAVALVDCTLIDGTGAPPVADAAVLVRNGRIQAAGPRISIGGTAGYETVSLHGAWLMPGFINAHVHCLYDAKTLRRWLAAGVTTVRDLGYGAPPDFLERRDELNRDPHLARIVAATPIITHTGGYGAVGVTGAEAARAAVKRYVDLGVDLVKIAIEDDLQGRRWPMMSAEEIRAAVSQAHASGKRVAAHISHVRNLSLALEAGVDDLAHMVVEPLSEDVAASIAAKGISWVPTLELWKGVSRKQALPRDAIAVHNTGVFFRAGGKIALGTDFNGYSIPFDTGFPITEAGLLLQAGLSPMDVIVAGTRNAAEVCGRASDLGTAEAGKIADLLAVRGNPLEDVNAFLETVQVFKEGRAVLK